MAVVSFDSQTLLKLVALLLPVRDSRLQLSLTCTWLIDLFHPLEHEHADLTHVLTMSASSGLFISSQTSG